MESCAGTQSTRDLRRRSTPCTNRRRRQFEPRGTGASDVKSFKGQTLSWEWREGVVVVTLDHAPANEIGTLMVADLEKLVAAIPAIATETSACIFTSARPQGFSAG